MLTHRTFGHESKWAAMVLQKRTLVQHPLTGDLTKIERRHCTLSGLCLELTIRVEDGMALAVRAWRKPSGSLRTA